MSDLNLQNLVPDFPPGPLDIYRKLATFDWRKMKFVLENPTKLRLKVPA